MDTTMRQAPEGGAGNLFCEYSCRARTNGMVMREGMGTEMVTPAKWKVRFMAREASEQGQ